MNTNTQVKAVIASTKQHYLLAVTGITAVLGIGLLAATLLEGWAVDLMSRYAEGWDPAAIDWVAVAAASLVQIFPIAMAIFGVAAAAYTRTYLGAGFSRDSYFKGCLTVSGMSALVIAAISGIVSLVVSLSGADMSTTVMLGQDSFTYNLNWAILTVGLYSFLAYWIGFAVSMLFVRWIWWIGLAVIAAWAILDTAGVWLIETFGWKDPFPGHAVQTDGYSVAANAIMGLVIIALAYFFMKRVQMRR